jgi:hypothetical protein
MSLYTRNDEPDGRIEEGNPYLDDCERALDLLARLTSAPDGSEKQEAQEHISALRRLIEQDFKVLLGKDEFPNEAEFFHELLLGLARFQEAVDFGKVSTRHTVAVGGPFSSGKSCFLNTLLSTSLLPVNIKPTTAIPTFIVSGEAVEITAQNIFKANIVLDEQELRVLCHEFLNKHKIALNHLVQRLFITLPAHPYPNLAILDTPGYSAGSARGQDAISDEQIAREQLQEADYIIWVLDCVRGSITESDIAFLNSIKGDKPLTLIFNRADLKIEQERREIVSTARDMLTAAGIPFEGIYLFSSFSPEISQRTEIEGILRRLNRKPRRAEHAIPFINILAAYEDYYKKEDSELGGLLEKMNGALLLFAEKPQMAKDLLKEQLERSRTRMRSTQLQRAEMDSMKSRIVDTLRMLSRSLQVEFTGLDVHIEEVTVCKDTTGAGEVASNKDDEANVADATGESGSGTGHAPRGQRVKKGSPDDKVPKQRKIRYSSITEALENVSPNAIIYVHPGVYRESLVLKKDVTIIGEGPAESIIIENLSAPCLVMETDYAKVVGLSLFGRAGQSKKECFTVDIAQGDLRMEDCSVTSDSLACIAVHGGATSPQINHCNIHSGKRVGIIFFDHARGELIECDIFSNKESGVEIKDNANPVVKQCRIHYNASRGMHIYDGGTGEIQDCVIFENGLSGITVGKDANPIIRNCRIEKGKNFGLFLAQNARASVENCHIKESKCAGVAVSAGARLVLHGCEINSNGYEGLQVRSSATVISTDCEFKNNMLGAWKVETGGVLHSNKNRE